MVAHLTLVLISQGLSQTFIITHHSNITQIEKNKQVPSTMNVTYQLPVS